VYRQLLAANPMYLFLNRILKPRGFVFSMCAPRLSGRL
jgi:hypothetical protein